MCKYPNAQIARLRTGTSRTRTGTYSRTGHFKGSRLHTGPNAVGPKLEQCMFTNGSGLLATVRIRALLFANGKPICKWALINRCPFTNGS